MDYNSLPLELRIEIANAALKYVELETISFAGSKAPVSVVSMEQGEDLFAQASEAHRKLNVLMQRAATILAGA